MIGTGKGGVQRLEQVVFGIHTGMAKHQVTLKEAHAIKKFFGVDIDKPLENEMHFYPQGITKLWIEETPTKHGMKYYLFMQINFTRVLGIGTHKIMPYSIANMQKVIKAVNKILRIMPLLDKNNKFQEWTEERFDPAFDIYEQRTPLLMRLLNSSLDLSDSRKKCRRIPIPDKPPEQVIYESMRFGNDSYVYNVYVKAIEILEKARKNGRTVTRKKLKKFGAFLELRDRTMPVQSRTCSPIEKLAI